MANGVPFVNSCLVKFRRKRVVDGNNITKRDNIALLEMTLVSATGG